MVKKPKTPQQIAEEAVKKAGGKKRMGKGKFSGVKAVKQEKKKLRG